MWKVSYVYLTTIFSTIRHVSSMEFVQDIQRFPNVFFILSIADNINDA